eukprot:TRINITY_DN161_c0_g2_i1.p2 TRINITY_DN161_c0_g2~~TRINITY_DN161_c0_g2_i1.p2  ORF type:complete len:126 (-),score=21.17 TRINITY_DN161_c0_g2_i1:166-543(-)
MENQASVPPQGGQAETYKVFMGARVLWPPDCPDDVVEAAIMETHNALRQYDIAKDGQTIAEHLKKFMDRKFEPYWHVFFGRNFGCYAIFEKRRFLYFYIDKNAFLFYKAGQTHTCDQSISIYVSN